MGLHTFDFEVNAASDITVENNTASAELTVSETELIRDNGEVVSFLYVGAGPGGGLGNVFTVLAKDTLNSVTIFVGAIEDGEPFQVDVYEFGEDGPGEQVASSIQVVAAGQGKEYTAYFAQPGVVLEDGKYLVVVTENGNNGVPLGITSSPVPDASSWVYMDGEWADLAAYGYASVFYIRPGFGTAAPEFDVAMYSLSTYKYVIKGNDIEVSGTILNSGVDAVSSITLGYSVDGAEPVTEELTGISAFGFYDFSFTAPLVINELGEHSFKIYISEPNGENDIDQTNDTISTFFTVLDYAPAKAVLGEEATGTWCGWCVRGHVFMEYMDEEYPESWIGIAVHNSDPMVVDDYDAAIGGLIPGYPSGLVNRAGVYDPMEFEAAYEQYIEQPSPVDVMIKNVSFDEESNEVSFDVSATFLARIEDARINAVIVENNVTGTTSGYNQANYYSGGDYGAMGGYEDLPNPVPAADMVYQNVARAILGGWDGTEGSVAANVAAGTTETQTYSIELDSDWDVAEIKLVGMVIDQNSGEILNATSRKVEGGGVTVTFNCDFNNDVTFNAADVVYVTGDFAGWAEPGKDGSVQLTDLDGDKIYSASVVLDANQTIQYKYFKNAGWNGGEWNGEPNRSLAIESADVATADVWGVISVPTSELQLVNVYPNPFNSNLTVANADKVNKIEVTNVVGQKLMTVVPSGSKVVISTSALEAGVYFITLTDNANNSRTERIVKE